MNAQGIVKTIRSRSPVRRHPGEKLYVLKSFNFSGTLIYTKGTIKHEGGQEVFYVFISAKIATMEE